MRAARPLPALILALLLPLAAQAEQRLDLERGDYPSQRAAIEQDLAGNERYREISAADRSALVDGLDAIERLLGASDAAGSQRSALLEAEREVNAILERAAADSRVICSRERSVGSRMAVNVCHTVAQRRRAREQAQGIHRGDQPATH